ncbi:MAG: fatty acid desaturase [Candidatus Marinimicrobia bacterium]|nr:fatty acid desaturase [Candidatus Neomarinimicrobiota bacterium]
MDKLRIDRDGVGLLRGVRRARTLSARLRGWLGFPCPPEAGLLFVPGGSLHTLAMRFPLDAVFLDREGRILKIRADVPPGRLIRAPRGTRQALELPAGRAAELELETGQRLTSAPDPEAPAAPRRARRPDERITVRDAAPLLLMHLAALSVFWVGFSWAALSACLLLYALRVFALTGGYHRYFAHKSYRTSRGFQFVLAFIGATAAQLGPLWWAAHHRHHHQHADQDADIHSPVRDGFWWAHIGWLLCSRHTATRLERIPDFARFPELRWLDRHAYLPPLLLAGALYGLGAALAATRPAGNVTGPQMLAWGFFLSTVLVYHATFCINSLMHLVGRRPYDTPDTSGNNLILALLTFGEGWHNNHHRYPIATRQGFRPGEMDITYAILRALERLGLVWDLREPPVSLAQYRTTNAQQQTRKNLSPPG